MISPERVGVRSTTQSWSGFYFAYALDILAVCCTFSLDFSASAFCEVAALFLSWVTTRPVTHHWNIPFEMSTGSVSPSLLFLSPTGWNLHLPDYYIQVVVPYTLPLCPIPSPFLVRDGLGAHEYVTARPGKVVWGP